MKETYVILMESGIIHHVYATNLDDAVSMAQAVKKYDRAQMWRMGYEIDDSDWLPV